MDMAMSSWNSIFLYTGFQRIYSVLYEAFTSAAEFLKC